jgi:hypothetical protein
MLWWMLLWSSPGHTPNVTQLHLVVKPQLGRFLRWLTIEERAMSRHPRLPKTKEILRCKPEIVLSVLESRNCTVTAEVDLIQFHRYHRDPEIHLLA